MAQEHSSDGITDPHGSLELLGDVFHEIGSLLGGHDHQQHHSGLDGVVAEPGYESPLIERYSLSDPLFGLHDFSFPAFTFPRLHTILVDTNGDGLPDHTAWGVPVIPVSAYVRADGTVVSGHYRTMPDGVAWNNLS
jgi:hypothetical protein